MFNAVRELTPPGVVEHSVKARFTQNVKEELVVSRGRQLEVFSVAPESGALRLVACFSLLGCVESISVIRGRVHQSCDLLALSFGTGRVSVVRYDPALGPNTLETVALYNFESDALGSNLRAESSGAHAVYGYGARAICVVDSMSRCGAMLVNGFQIAVMPFDKLRKLNNKRDVQKEDGEEDGVKEEVGEDGELAGVDDEPLDEEEEIKLKLAKAVRRVAMHAEDVWEMPSGCYLIDLTKLGVPSASVQHMEFLHDQHGLPVLAILHSGWIRSGTGRLVACRWTNHLTAITISKQDVSVVWKVRKLPHDSFAIAPMKNGGALVLAQNTVHHIIGGFVRRSLEMNGFAKLTAEIDPVADSKAPIELSLDGARWLWVDSYRLLLSLRHGQMALLDVGPTSLRVSLLGLSTQSTCLTLLNEKFMFVGSRLGDSLLMSYKLYLEEIPSTGYEIVPTGDATVDEEEKWLYGPDVTLSTSGATASTALNGNMDSKIKWQRRAPFAKYTKHKALVLNVVDSLPCVGPIAGLSVGENPPDVMEVKRAELQAKELQKKGLHSAAARVLRMAKESAKSRRKPKEVIVSAGRARDGGVRVVAPGLRLDTTDDLLVDQELSSPALSIWTLNLTPQKPECLVFTTFWNTASFEIQKITGDGRVANVESLGTEEVASIQEAKSPTLQLHAWKGFLVQACLDRLVVMSSEAPFQILHTHEESIRAAFMCEDYVLVVLRSRIPKLFKLDQLNASLQVVDGVFPTEEHGSSALAPVVCAYIFRHFDAPTGKNNILCGIVRGGVVEASAGALEVYQIEDKRLLFRSERALALGHTVLHHCPPEQPLVSNQGVLAKVKVVSLCIALVGRVEEEQYSIANLVPPDLCVAIAMGNGDLLLYRVHENWERLSRVQSTLVTRIDRNLLNRSGRQMQADVNDSEQQQQQQGEHSNRQADTSDPSSSSTTMPTSGGAGEESLERKRSRAAAFGGNEGDGEDREKADVALERTATKEGQQQHWKASTTRPMFRSNPRLISFDYLGGFCGMMLINELGTSACIIGSRGFVHPVRLDFDAYHVWNVSVNRGRLFLLATSKTGSRTMAMESAARLMVFKRLKLMQNLRLDAGGALPIIQVPLRCSVTKIAFDSDSRAFMLLCAQDDPVEERALAVRASCSIRLLCADTLAITHQYSLMRHEKAITIQRVTIDMAPPNTTPRRFVDYLAVGTGFVGPDGEDSGCKGRVLLFQVDTMSRGENGEVLKRIALRLKIESRHIRGPVTSVSSMDGLLLASFGTTPSSIRVFYYDTNTEEFVARSFIDTPFSAICMKTIKNYILVGDLYKSVQFLHWHNLKREFRVLAKDTQPLQVYSCDFVQYERSLGMVVTDSDENLHIMQFEHTKNFLQLQGEIHLGSAVNDMLQVQVAQDKSIVLFGTLDGSIGAVVPMGEQVYRRLFALQAAMSTSPLVPRNAGLHPRGFRTAKYHFTLQRQRKRNVADGVLLWSFLTLDNITQRQLARLIGTTPETIHQDLLELDAVIFSKAL